MRPKGIRQIRTAPRNGLRHAPGSREQAVSELARLEHERARLDRTLQIWIANQQQVSAQLDEVHARIALIQRTLQPAAAPPPNAALPTPDKHIPAWNAVQLEY